MRFIDEEVLAKIKALPPDRREMVVNGLVAMLVERPRGNAKELRNVDMQAAAGLNFRVKDIA